MPEIRPNVLVIMTDEERYPPPYEEAGVTTMGDWFRAAGYSTHYRGKWHISHADLIPGGSHLGLMANDRAGTVDPEVVDLYQRADRLDRFGFCLLYTSPSPRDRQK